MAPSEQSIQHRFLRTYTAHEPALRAFVRRMVPARADADDIMQEISVVLWEKFATFSGSDFRPWAFGVARFEILAWLRDRARDRLVLDEEVVLQLTEEAAGEEPQLDQQRRALEDCMAKVPGEHCELLMQAYHSEARIQQVAQASGRTVPGFYQWLHRMRRGLLDCIRRAVAREPSP